MDENRILDLIGQAVQESGDDVVVVVSPPGSGADWCHEVVRGLRGGLTKREQRMIGYSAETKQRIIRLIELSPVLEDAILEVVELAYMDGAESEH